MTDFITKSLVGLKVWKNTKLLVSIELAILARSGDKWAIEEIERIKKHNAELDQPITKDNLK